MDKFNSGSLLEGLSVPREEGGLVGTWDAAGVIFIENDLLDEIGVVLESLAHDLSLSKIVETYKTRSKTEGEKLSLVSDLDGGHLAPYLNCRGNTARFVINDEEFGFLEKLATLKYRNDVFYLSSYVDSWKIWRNVDAESFLGKFDGFNKLTSFKDKKSFLIVDNGDSILRNNEGVLDKSFDFHLSHNSEAWGFVDEQLIVSVDNESWTVGQEMSLSKSLTRVDVVGDGRHSSFLLSQFD